MTSYLFTRVVEGAAGNGTGGAGGEGAITRPESPNNISPWAILSTGNCEHYPLFKYCVAL